MPLNICFESFFSPLSFDLLYQRIRLPLVLVCSGCCNKNTFNWAAWKQHTLASHGSGSWEPKVVGQQSGCSVRGHFLVHRWCHLPASSHGTSVTGSLWGLLCGTSAIYEGVPLMPQKLPKAPPPSTITLGMRFQRASFGGTQTFCP